MTIHEVVEKLQEEKRAAVPSRFPCRAIMVKNIQQYCALLSELKSIPGLRIVKSDELFPSADVLPNYDSLTDRRYWDEWILLPGVSEYLRLFGKCETTDARFAALWHHQVAATSTGRIIIPLWDCESQWFDAALNLAGDIRQDEFFFKCYEADDAEQRMHLLVLSGMFDRHIQKLESVQGNLKIGMQEWFDYWADPVPNEDEFVILTKRCGSVSTANGNVSVHVIPDILTFAQERMPGGAILNSGNCTSEMQETLFDYALQGVSLNEALLRVLNIASFSGVDVMSKWKNMAESHKRFVGLWFALHPDDTYLCHCFAIAPDVVAPEATLLHEIFKVRQEKPAWASEYRQLLLVMGLVPDKQVFQKLDAIPVYNTRLDFLTGSDRDERRYLLQMVGKWLREDSAQVLSSVKLREIYPDLFFYLSDNIPSLSGDLKNYLSRYKSYKLENTLPDDEDTYFSGIQMDAYDMRYALLTENIDQDTELLWIDALGVEWLSLLHQSVSQKCDATVKVAAVGLANLPTETKFNDQWHVMDVPYTKLDKLDKLAHKGVIDDPDYFACVEEQLSFISSISDTVSALLQRHHRVIITGDHGTSRLAARFFHSRSGMETPRGTTVYSHGRYCDMQPDNAPPIPHLRWTRTPAGERFAVFENYDHFKTSGFAAGGDDETAIYGEVHGGATPEEVLVPILVIDSARELPLTATLEAPTIKISMRKARFRLQFNRPVQELQARINGIDGETSCGEQPNVWNVVFSGIRPGTYSLQVYANNKILALPDVTIKPALGGGEGDLP